MFARFPVLQHSFNKRSISWPCTRRLYRVILKQHLIRIRNVSHNLRFLNRDPKKQSIVIPGAIFLTVATSTFFFLNDVSVTPLTVASTSLEALSNIIDTTDDPQGLPTVTLLNWSGTHQVHIPSRYYYEPNTEEDVVSILSKCHDMNLPVRPVGSALSPNGISFQPQGMISLANLDSVLDIHSSTLDGATVRVQAGATVSQLLHVLRLHGWTLPNLASIAEQQLGGFVQVSAHGTGAQIPPVDDFVVAMTLVTPSKGLIHLSPEKDEGLFHLAKVGLGCLGIVTELTLKCIPVHNLIEHTFVLTREQAKAQIPFLLKQHKHVRYMWIPYEDTVVVVTNDPDDGKMEEWDEPIQGQDVQKKLKPFIDLMWQLQLLNEDEDPVSSNRSFADLRDQLIAYDPLNEAHIRRVNQAEAEFWRRSEGYQIKPSDQLLQFDCGGQVGGYIDS